MIIRNEDIREILQKTRFTENLIRLNSSGMQGFSEWIFEPGMLFDSRIAWWKSRRTRKSSHEGLDICSYRVRSGGTHSLRSGTVIPAMFAGELVKTEPDFLGKSLYFHINSTFEEGHLYIIYGHTEPLSSVTVGIGCAEGEGIALLADTRMKQPLIPPHLHITIAVVSPSVLLSELSWNMMDKADQVTLLNPLLAIDGPFTLLPG